MWRVNEQKPYEIKDVAELKWDYCSIWLGYVHMKFEKFYFKSIGLWGQKESYLNSWEKAVKSK